MGRMFYNLTRLSKEELQKANVFAYYRCNLKNLSLKLTFVAFMFLVSIEYVINNDNGKILILFCVGILCEVIFRPFLNPVKAEEQTVCLEAYANYMILSDLEDKILVHYDEINDMVENKKFYFIVFNNNTYIAINKNSFINSNNSEFKNFILEKHNEISKKV